MSPHRPFALSALAFATVLTGCASVSVDDAIAPVQQAVQTHTQSRLERWPDAQAPSDAARQRIDALIQRLPAPSMKDEA